MAFWINLCIILLGSTVLRHYCWSSSHRSHNPKVSKIAAQAITRTDPVVGTDDRSIRSKSQRTKQVADLMMIMDISGSLNKSDQRYQRNALRSLSKSKLINIGKNNVRIGIVAFETWAHMILPLDKGISRTAIYDAAAQVDLFKFYKIGWGFTNFPDAMNMAKDQLANGRKVIKVAILVTDGNENCLPSQVMLHKPCADTRDCNDIAEHCPRPHHDQDICDCNTYKKWKIPCVRSAVFGEFAQLKKAGGRQVTLAIIGVGYQINQQGRDRLNCWATEKMYQEVPSYSELENTIERLVTTILPVDPDDDCMSDYYTNEHCKMDKHKRCGRYYYLKITKNRTGSGRPCPEKKIWRLCRYSECGVTFIPKDYNPIPEVVRPPKAVDSSSGIAWWLIFIILLAALALILCVAILLMAVMRKRRARRAITAGVQPSVMESVTVRPGSQETSKSEGSGFPGGLGHAHQKPGPGVGRCAQQSLSANRSAPSSSGLFQKTAQRKAAFMDKSGKAPVSRMVSSQTSQERDIWAQPGRSLTPSNITKLKSQSKAGFKGTAFGKL